MDDTGRNTTEYAKTLMAQQRQLVLGLRPAQMFPLGTPELPLPEGISRVEAERGIFHFDPAVLSAHQVEVISSLFRENEILGLGPYSKADVVAGGGPFLVITERTPEGIEVKAAVGNERTLPEQFLVLRAGALPGSTIAVESMEDVLDHRRIAA